MRSGKLDWALPVGVAKLMGDKRLAQKANKSRDALRLKAKRHAETDFSATDLAFSAFAFMWALGLLSHNLQFFTMRWGVAQEYAMGATIGTAMWAVLKPSSIFRFLLVSLSALCCYLTATPHINNHEVMFGLLSALFIAAFVVAQWQRGMKGSVTRAEFYQAFRTPACWMVIVLYFWATVHKLNTGYLDKELSCATMQLFNLQSRSVFGFSMSFVPTSDWARYLAMYGTLAIEGAIPVLLAIPRTRIMGVALAGVFHFVLGFGYPSFSAFIFSQLALFLPPSFWSGALGWWGESAGAQRLAGGLPWGKVRTWVQAALICFAIYALYTDFAYLVPARAEWTMRYTCWLVYGLAALIAFAWLVPRARQEPATSDPLFRASHPVLMLAPLLLFLNGLAPHIGVKATQSMAMYSNLRTEGGTTNHLFIPASWQIFDLERDLVTIEWSTDPLLYQLSRASWRAHRPSPYLGTFILRPERLETRYPEPPTWRLPFVSMKQHLRFIKDLGAKNVSIVYTRGGERYSVTNAEADPELTDVPLWQSKLFRLRAVPSIEEGCCMW